MNGVSIEARCDTPTEFNTAQCAETRTNFKTAIIAAVTAGLKHALLYNNMTINQLEGTETPTVEKLTISSRLRKLAEKITEETEVRMLATTVDLLAVWQILSMPDAISTAFDKAIAGDNTALKSAFLAALKADATVGSSFNGTSIGTFTAEKGAAAAETSSAMSVGVSLLAVLGSALVGLGAMF